jgi:hypothetical protein
MSRRLRCCNGLQFKSAIADGSDEVRRARQMRQARTT